MLTFIWNEIFFRPLLNILIGLYNTIGLENLGLSIIWLTFITRLILLPFSFKAEKQRKKQAEVSKELRVLQTSYANNPSVLRQEQKELLRRSKVRRWPKIISLAVQGFILLILYQVFVGGIKLEQIVDTLYGFVDVPVFVNTVFLGIDIAQRNLIFSIIPAAVLFITIIIDHGGLQTKWTKKDLVLLIGFPLATFIFLFALPAVKAIFILGSQLFSLSLRFLTNFFESVSHQDKLMNEQSEKEMKTREEGLQHPRDRFN